MVLRFFRGGKGEFIQQPATTAGEAVLFTEGTVHDVMA